MYNKRLRKIIIENKKKLPVEMEEVLDLLLSGLLWEAVEEDREHSNYLKIVGDSV